MSLTAAHHAFASVSQDGVNKALQAFFTARPHYLNYGSPPFVTANSVSETVMAPIPFPGTPGIPWAVDFTHPGRRPRPGRCASAAAAVDRPGPARAADDGRADHRVPDG